MHPIHDSGLPYTVFVAKCLDAVLLHRKARGSVYDAVLGVVLGTYLRQIGRRADRTWSAQACYSQPCPKPMPKSSSADSRTSPVERTEGIGQGRKREPSLVIIVLH